MTGSVRGFSAGSPDEIAALEVPWLRPRFAPRAWEAPGVEMVVVTCPSYADDSPVTLAAVNAWGVDPERAGALAAALATSLSAHTGGLSALWGGDERAGGGRLAVRLAGAAVEDRRGPPDAWLDTLDMSAGLQAMDLDAARVSGRGRRWLFDVVGEPEPTPGPLARAWLFARPEDLPPLPTQARATPRNTPLRTNDFDATSFPFVVLDGLDLDGIDAVAAAAHCDAVAAQWPERLGGRWTRGTRAPDVRIGDAAALTTLLLGLSRTLETRPIELR
jgi:hypothetical protein